MEIGGEEFEVDSDCFDVMNSILNALDDCKIGKEIGNASHSQPHGDNIDIDIQTSETGDTNEKIPVEDLGVASPHVVPVAVGLAPDNTPSAPAPEENEICRQRPGQNVSELLLRIKEKEEELRRFKLLESYEKQHTIEELLTLVADWKRVARTTILEWYQRRKKVCSNMRLQDLLNHLDVDPSQIEINVEEIEDEYED